MKQKLTSRKFWLCLAAFLASVAGSVAGMNMGNEIITGIGAGCSILSAGIYAMCEAWVDVNRVKGDEKNE